MFDFLFKKRAPKVSQEQFYSSSEFVSSGHPDRLCDNLAAVIINDIQKKDGMNSHAAIEVFITHDTIIIGGEATTTLDLNYPYLKKAVRKAFDRSGYIKEMRKYWTKDEVMLASNFKIVNKICAQSPDIALGTTDKGEESGWNDQGVYFSSADNTMSDYLGAPMHLADAIGRALQDKSRESILNPIHCECGLCENIILGPDNKVVVTCKTAPDGFTPIEVTAVTVAVAHASCTDIECVRCYVKSLATKIINDEGIAISEACQWVINGTGRFVVHGPISDTSMTGRKISVNHPSAGPVWANKMIGGGSLVKPWHASDLLLNVASRFVANVIVAANLSTYAVVGCAGAIGQKGLQSIFIKGDEAFELSNKDKVYQFFAQKIDWSPKGLSTLLGFWQDGFDFGEVVNDNFFGYTSQPWDDVDLVQKWAIMLRDYMA